jgi:hypothetical protein
MGLDFNLSSLPQPDEPEKIVEGPQTEFVKPTPIRSKADIGGEKTVILGGGEGTKAARGASAASKIFTSRTLVQRSQSEPVQPRRRPVDKESAKKIAQKSTEDALKSYFSDDGSKKHIEVERDEHGNEVLKCREFTPRERLYEIIHGNEKSAKKDFALLEKFSGEHPEMHIFESEKAKRKMEQILYPPPPETDDISAPVKENVKQQEVRKKTEAVAGAIVDTRKSQALSVTAKSPPVKQAAQEISGELIKFLKDPGKQVLEIDKKGNLVCRSRKSEKNSTDWGKLATDCIKAKIQNDFLADIIRFHGGSERIESGGKSMFQDVRGIYTKEESAQAVMDKLEKDPTTRKGVLQEIAARTGLWHIEEEEPYLWSPETHEQTMDSQRNTVLHYACMSEDPETIDCAITLLNKLPDIALQSENSDRKTPVELIKENPTLREAFTERIAATYKEVEGMQNLSFKDKFKYLEDIYVYMEMRKEAFSPEDWGKLEESYFDTWNKIEADMTGKLFP